MYPTKLLLADPVQITFSMPHTFKRRSELCTNSSLCIYEIEYLTRPRGDVWIKSMKRKRMSSIFFKNNSSEVIRRFATQKCACKRNPKTDLSDFHRNPCEYVSKFNFSTWRRTVSKTSKANANLNPNSTNNLPFMTISENSFRDTLFPVTNYQHLRGFWNFKYTYCPV